MKTNWASRIGVVSLLVSSAASSFGVDYEKGVRSVQRHGDWMSFEFRNPVYGFFMMSRASTEQKLNNATLTINFTPTGSSCTEEIQVILKSESKFEDGKNKDGLVELQFGSRPPMELPANLVYEKGERHAFVTIKSGVKSDEFLGYKSAIINIRGSTVVEFSLDGYAAARETALDHCRAFVIR